MNHKNHRQTDRVANELLELISSGVVRLRQGSNTDGTIPVGCIPTLLALSLLPIERRLDWVVSRIVV